MPSSFLLQVRVTCLSPPTALMMVGAPGTPATGRAVSEAAAPWPLLLTARTWKVYSLLCSSALTSYLSATGPRPTGIIFNQTCKSDAT